MTDNFPASLLVDKAEFLAQRQLEEEYPENPHPNPPSLRPHHFYYGTNVDDENDPERKKHENWQKTKDRRVCMIAQDIASDPSKTSNKEDRATTQQVDAELIQRRYYYNAYRSSLTPPNKENKPPPRKKGKKQTTKSPP